MVAANSFNIIFIAKYGSIIWPSVNSSTFPMYGRLGAWFDTRNMSSFLRMRNPANHAFGKMARTIISCHHYKTALRFALGNTLFVVGAAAGLVCTAVRYYAPKENSKGLLNSDLFGRFIPEVQAKQLRNSVNSDRNLKRSGLTEEEERQISHLTSREKRFVRFASIEYEGQLYMTPQDFLESVTDTEPRARIRRKVLTKKEVDHLRDNTTPRKKGNTRLFRDMQNKGIISYTEYLFLLSVLTKPHSGFRIAFNMFDTDGNQKIDKEEFLVLEKIFSIVNRKKTITEAGKDGTIKTELSLDTQHPVDTTLLVHLFGKKGKDQLSFDDFYRFMDNLQTEVLELEFTEFSRGMPTISEVDFARILLRYTYVRSDDYDAYIERVKSKIPHEVGITFEQFKSFCQFLNNLDDFAIVMSMFTFANRPISQEEFHRAVMICTGHTLDRNIVNTVFQIFDEDDDGHLSYHEFIAMMRDRLHRGFRSHLIKADGWGGYWESFKSCVKNEMRP